MPKGLNTEINYVVFEELYNCKIIQMIDNLCKMCVLYSCYKLNFKNEGTITLVTVAFSHYIAFVIEVACGFIAKMSGDALVIFLLDYLIPAALQRGRNENPKATYFQFFSPFNNGDCFDMHFCRLRQ